MIFRDVTYETFKNEIAGKSVICVGCGQMFFDMFTLWEDDITKKICLGADSEKGNTSIYVKGRSIKVIDVSQLPVLNFRDKILLITSMYCMSLYRILSDLLSDIPVVCYAYPLMSLRIDNDIYTVNMDKQRIPKIIHYCWFGKNSLPKMYRDCIDSWKRTCPDYEIVEWNESNYDIEKNLYMKQAYENKKWGFVPDYARLDLIYEYGGIYLDTDVEMLKSYDEFLCEHGFFGFQRNFWVGLGLGFGAERNSSLIKEMRDMYEEISFVLDDGTFNMVPSPYYQTQVLLRKGLKCNNCIQEVDGFKIYPTDVFDPCGFRGGKVQHTSNTHSIHHYGESWVGDKRIELKRRYKELKDFIDLTEELKQI